MQLTVPPDLEILINKRLASGLYSSAEDVLRHALAAQDAAEDLTEADRQVLAGHVEARYLESEASESVNGQQARVEIAAMKEAWRQGRSRKS